MTGRLLSTMKLDATIQFRHRFYYVAIGTAVLVGAALRQLGNQELITRFMPAIFLTAVCVMAGAYIATLIIYERDQHTLDALFVSPLRLTEYLNSKMFSLAMLVLIEGIVLTLIAVGLTGTNWLWLFIGTVLLGILFALCGTILVVRYATITDFLIPASLVILFLELPALYFVGLSDHPLWLLIPSSAPTMLLWGAWNPLEMWQIIYALGYLIVIFSLGYRWALRAFRKHVLA